MEPLRATLGHTIRDLRSAAGFSQEKFAAAVGLHRTFMGNLERGRTNPSLETLERIARVLGLSVAALMGAVEQRRGAEPAQLGGAFSPPAERKVAERSSP